ncbi:MAG TPA: O-antigen ligase family protein [Bacteroidia bacterium]|jgi:O-antigen ligase|nr:O-antigen ligase family protein [Bacteroidia bacterium]
MLKPQEIFPVQSKPIQKAVLVLLALVAFTLPFKDHFLVNLFIVLVIIVWLFSNPFKTLFTKRENYGSLLAIVIFYLLHALSFLYTANIQESFINLETKVSLLAFPLIFYTAGYTNTQSKFFLKNFVAGCLLCCVICLVHSTYVSVTEGRNYFFYQDLSWFQHPSYLSMYITFCCVTIFRQELYGKMLQVILALFFTLFVLMLSSKSGILIHVVFLLAYFITAYLAARNYKRLFLFAGISVLLVISIVVFIPKVKERFQNVVNVFKSEKIDKSATESTAVRILIWNEATGIIKQHPLLGVSPGDANTTLYDTYQKNGLTGAYAKKLNTHNEYFQTGVGLGLLGLASLISLFVLPFFGDKKKLMVFFLLITAVNFFTESMLQTMAGCIFFGYFYAMLCFENPKPEITS